MYKQEPIWGTSFVVHFVPFSFDQRSGQAELERFENKNRAIWYLLAWHVLLYSFSVYQILLTLNIDLSIGVNWF